MFTGKDVMSQMAQVKDVLRRVSRNFRDTSSLSESANTVAIIVRNRAAENRSYRMK